MNPVTLSALEIARPGDARYDEVRPAWNLTVDQHPAAVAVPRDAEQVVAAVLYAKREGLRIAAQGTGHNASPLGDLSDTLLIKTHEMRGVEIDASSRVARVEAGAQWGDVVGPAGEHGLAALAGSSHDVGVVGYSLGGGISFLARRYGLSANRILAAEVVTADGELVRADRRQNTDLFWAIRGGGGAFGVITALELELFDLPTVYAGAAFFPIERASEVLHAWRELTEKVDDRTTSIGRILRVPPFPDIPEPFRGKHFAMVEVIHIGDQRSGDEVVKGIRDLEPAIDAFVAANGADSGSDILTAEIRHLGGAIARPDASHGAAHIDAEYVSFAASMAVTPDMAAKAEQDLARMDEAFEPYQSARKYLNFTEKPSQPGEFFEKDTLDRLRAIKAKVDPEGIFRSNQPID
ncbi:MAG: FAD-binding oxidoreductase [Actinobacteria bacterium]|nr:MAG: FAD-binding oxidoreductase [Actinomycetota bacterium]